MCNKILIENRRERKRKDDDQRNFSTNLYFEFGIGWLFWLPKNSVTITVRTAIWNWNWNKTVSKQFRNCFVSVSFRRADILRQRLVQRTIKLIPQSRRSKSTTAHEFVYVWRRLRWGRYLIGLWYCVNHLLTSASHYANLQERWKGRTGKSRTGFRRSSGQWMPSLQDTHTDGYALVPVRHYELTRLREMLKVTFNAFALFFST